MFKGDIHNIVGKGLPASRKGVRMERWIKLACYTGGIFAGAPVATFSVVGMYKIITQLFYH